MLARLTVRPAFRRPIHRRRIFTEAVQTLSDAYLELAIALPYPPTWPAYSSTIVLVGVVSRLALFPVFIWVRNRERRAENFVVPYLRAYRYKLKEKVQKEIDRKNGEAARVYFENIVSKKLKKKRDELFKVHRCTPWVTMLAPPTSQIPIYVTISAVLYNVARDSYSVLRDEAFLTLSSLARPDPTATLPIMLGIISLASVETSKWFLTEERRRRLMDREQKEAAKSAAGKIIIRPSKYIQSILRGLCVGRIVLAVLAPGSVQVYWLTSATFGLFQNWVLNWHDHHLETMRKGAKSSLSVGSASALRRETPRDR